jgi:hypothetical protein
MLSDYFEDASASPSLTANNGGGGGGDWAIPNFFADDLMVANDNNNLSQLVYFPKDEPAPPPPPSVVDDNATYLPWTTDSSASSSSSSSFGSNSSAETKEEMSAFENENSSMEYETNSTIYNSSVDYSPCQLDIDSKAKALGLQASRIQSRRSPPARRNTDLRMTLLDKKKRHRELEINRRQKMNDKFEELYNICEAPKKDKGSVLECARIRLEQSNDASLQILSLLNPVSEFTNLMEPTVPIETQASSVRTQDDGESFPIISFPQGSALPVIDEAEVLVKPRSFVLPGKSPVPFALLSTFGSVLDCNDSFSQLFGVSACQLTGVSLFSLAMVSDLSTLYTKFEEILSQSRASCSFACSFITSSGTVISRCILSSSKQAALHLMLVPSRIQ